MRVGLYDDPIFREHDAGSGHPERPERLEAVREGLREAGLESELELREPRPAARDELLAVHTPEQADVNLLTIDAWDPKSGTAEFKATAVAIEPLAG